MWDEVKSNDPSVEKHSSGHPLPGSNFIFRIKSIFKKIASKPPMAVLLLVSFFFWLNLFTLIQPDTDSTPECNFGVIFGFQIKYAKKKVRNL